MRIARSRKLLVLSTTVAALGASGAMTVAVASSRLPVHHDRPTIAGKMIVGKTLHASPGRWSGVRGLSFRWQRCNPKGAARCGVIRTGRASHPVTARRYTLTKADVGHRIRVVVRGRNKHGATSANSRFTAMITSVATSGGSTGGSTTTLPAPAAPGSAPQPKLFTLVPSSGDGTAPAGIPRSDAQCAAAVTPTAEKRPSNTTANNTVPADPAAIVWNPAYSAWPKFVADRKQVTGDFKGTTDEIIQWAACKWGLDVNVARAEAWLESGWYMSTRSGCPGPEASFGLFQIMAEDCNGNQVHGGWPYVQNDTALNADYWGSWIRGCFDGAFLSPGHPWQNSPAQGYDGQIMAKVIAAHGETYALWGCVGAWFSNGWYTTPANGYIQTVQKDEQTQLWLQPGT